MLARFLPLGAEFQGDVEVLGPELDQRWVAVGLLGPKLLEHRAGEAVVVAEGRRGRGIDVGERLPGLLAPALADEPRRARPAPGSRRRPARRTASRTRRACSGGRSRSPASAPARPPPPRPCGGQRGLGEARRQRLEPLPRAEPALRAPRCELRLELGDLVPGQIAAVGDGRDQLRPSGTSPGPTGSSAKGNSVTAGERAPARAPRSRRQACPAPLLSGPPCGGR